MTLFSLVAGVGLAALDGSRPDVAALSFRSTQTIAGVRLAALDRGRPGRVQDPERRANAVAGVRLAALDGRRPGLSAGALAPAHAVAGVRLAALDGGRSSGIGRPKRSRPDVELRHGLRDQGHACGCEDNEHDAGHRILPASVSTTLACGNCLR